MISLLLCSCDCLDHCFELEHKYFAKFKLRIRDQVNNKHVENLGKSYFSILSFCFFVFFFGVKLLFFLNIVFLSGKHWFSNSSNEWGFSKFLCLKDLQDLSKGFLENDTLIVQAEILLMSTIK